MLSGRARTVFSYYVSLRACPARPGPVRLSACTTGAASTRAMPRLTPSSPPPWFRFASPCPARARHPLRLSDLHACCVWVLALCCFIGNAASAEPLCALCMHVLVLLRYACTSTRSPPALGDLYFTLTCSSAPTILS